MSVNLTWPAFLLMFSAEAWFFGQLPPLCSETAHYGVWETSLRELAMNENLIINHHDNGNFEFVKKGSPANHTLACEAEGKIFLCINTNGNTKEDPFTECWTTTGILHESLFLAKQEMLCAEDYIKGGGKESVPIIPSDPPTQTEVK